MRLGELLTLEWTLINLEQRTATLSLTKNGEKRMVPLSPVALATLGAITQQTAFLRVLEDQRPRSAAAISGDRELLAVVGKTLDQFCGGQGADIATAEFADHPVTVDGGIGLLAVGRFDDLG